MRGDGERRGMWRVMVRLRALERKNRLRVAGRGLLPWLLVPGLGGLGAALFMLGQTTLPPADLPPEALAEALAERGYLLRAAMCFLIGAGSFEVLYRARGATNLAALPFDSRSLFIDRLGALYLAHLPLLVALALLQAPLIEVAPRALAVEFAIDSLVWLLTPAAGLWLHTLAGVSLLRGTSLIKEFFGAGMRVDSAALMLYSPAAVFAVGLSAAILLAQAFRPLLSSSGQAGPALVGTLLVFTAIAGFVLHSAALFKRSWRAIRARFREAEMLPPWREGPLPVRVYAQSPARLFSPPLRGLYLAMLLNLRRRHRLDLMFTVLASGALFWFNLATTLPLDALLAWNAMLLLLAVAVVLTPIYRLTGRELSPPGCDALFRPPAAALTTARVLIALTHQLPITISVAAGYGIKTAQPVGVLLLLMIGVGAGLLASLLYLWIRGRRSGAWLPWANRGAWLLVALTLVLIGS